MGLRVPATGPNATASKGDTSEVYPRADTKRPPNATGKSAGGSLLLTHTRRVSTGIRPVNQPSTRARNPAAAGCADRGAEGGCVGADGDDGEERTPCERYLASVSLEIGPHQGGYGSTPGRRNPGAVYPSKGQGNPVMSRPKEYLNQLCIYSSRQNACVTRGSNPRSRRSDD